MASMEQIKSNLRTLNDKEIDVINSINDITNGEDTNIIDGINTMITQLEGTISSVQSDWNVNDSQEMSFIKNRPFYVDGNTIKKIDSQFLPTDLVVEGQMDQKIDSVLTRTEDMVNQKINAIFTLDGTTLIITTN